MNESDKLRMCRGCRDDYYNQAGNSQTGRCWGLANAKVVTRYRIGWWTQPTQPGAYTKVQTLDCHHAPGQYALHQTVSECCPDKSRVEKQEAS